jgi:hypothetical protein
MIEKKLSSLGMYKKVSSENVVRIKILSFSYVFTIQHLVNVHGISAFEPLSTLSLEGADNPENKKKHVRCRALIANVPRSKKTVSNICAHY